MSPMLTTCLAHLPNYIPLSSSLCKILQPYVTSSLLGPNILLSTLFSNTLSLCSSLNVRDCFAQSYKTASKIIVLGPRYFNLYSFTVVFLRRQINRNESRIIIKSLNLWVTKTGVRKFAFLDATKLFFQEAKLSPEDIFQQCRLVWRKTEVVVD
jgi:hypothetical protein